MVKKKKSAPRKHKVRNSHKDSPKMLIAGVALIAIVLLLIGGKTLKKSSDLSPQTVTLQPTTLPTATTIPTATTKLYQVENAVQPTPTPTKKPGPTIDSSFQPIKPNNLLFGQITAADCSGISGFTFEISNNGSPDILIMQHHEGDNGGAGIGGPAMLPSQDVNDFYHISGNHRFFHALPEYIPGKTYSYRVYAEGAGQEFQLVNSPVELTCP